MNQNPEQLARDRIDQMLEKAGWIVQSKKKIDFSAGQGIAIREYQTDVGPADYVLFVNRKPVGIIEAKREEEGHRLTVVEDQSKGYAAAKLKYLNNDPLPFVYESTGIVTRFRDFRDSRIKVEVKHRNNTMGATELRSFIGGLRGNEKGVYLSTGGFTQEAKYEAERANNSITPVNLDMLVELIIQYYDNFDAETRALVPLKKIYWPI